MLKYSRGERVKRFIDNDWWPVLEPEFEKPYYQKLRKFLVEEYSNHKIYQQ